MLIFSPDAAPLWCRCDVSEHRITLIWNVIETLERIFRMAHWAEWLWTASFCRVIVPESEGFQWDAQCCHQQVTAASAAGPLTSLASEHQFLDTLVAILSGITMTSRGGRIKNKKNEKVRPQVSGITARGTEAWMFSSRTSVFSGDRAVSLHSLWPCLSPPEPAITCALREVSLPLHCLFSPSLLQPTSQRNICLLGQVTVHKNFRKCNADYYAVTLTHGCLQNIMFFPLGVQWIALGCFSPQSPWRSAREKRLRLDCGGGKGKLASHPKSMARTLKAEELFSQSKYGIVLKECSFQYGCKKTLLLLSRWPPCH